MVFLTIGSANKAEINFFSGIATGQTLHVRRKYMAKDCFDVQKKPYCREVNAFFAAVLS